MYDLAYLQMAGDMEQQIPVISVPMPGKDHQNEQINAEKHAIRVTIGQFHLSTFIIADMRIVHILATKQLLGSSYN